MSKSELKDNDMEIYNEGIESIRSEIPKSNLNTINSPIKNKPKLGPELHTFDRINWLIHLHYTRGEIQRCQCLINEQLSLTGGQCEYAVFVQAMIQRTNGEIQTSLESFQKCVSINPINLENLKQVARSLYLLARYKAAIDVYTEAGKIIKSDWEISHNKGVCYMNLKNYEQAKQNLRDALTINQNDKSYEALAKIWVIEGDLQNAVDVYLRGLEFSPENSEMLTNLGLIYIKLGQYNKAFEKLGNAMTYDLTNTKATLAVGCIMQRHGDPDVALSKYKTASTILPESSPLWNNIGMCFFDKKKFVAAISCLKRAYYLAPFDWMTLHNLGLVHLHMQQYASAFHFLSAAINVRPKHAILFMMLAVALTHLDDLSNAKHAYQQALKLDKNNSLISLNYAVFLLNCNDRQGANKAFCQFENCNKVVASSNVDLEQEINNLSSRLGPALQVGESLVWKGGADQSSSAAPPQQATTGATPSPDASQSGPPTTSSSNRQQLAKPKPTVIPTGMTHSTNNHEFALVARDAVVSSTCSSDLSSSINEHVDF